MSVQTGFREPNTYVYSYFHKHPVPKMLPISISAPAAQIKQELLPRLLVEPWRLRELTQM